MSAVPTLGPFRYQHMSAKPYQLTAHFACTFDLLALVISNEAYLYPRLDTDWPEPLKHGLLSGAKAYRTQAALPIGHACTFDFSASTFVYQKNIVTSIVSGYARRYWSCDMHRGY